MAKKSNFWKSLPESAVPFHLYTRKGEAFTKTIIFWVSMIFGLHTISNDANPEIIGGGFLMFSLAMIMEYVFMAMDRRFLINLLPGILVLLNSYVVVISASYFTTAPMKSQFPWLMRAVYGSLIIITLDTISLFLFVQNSKSDEEGK